MKESGRERTKLEPYTISDLPDDLIGNILSRVSITSLTVLRSTCKRWNNLSKTHLFGKKVAKNQPFLGFMLTDYKVCSLRFNLQGISNNGINVFVDLSLKKIKIRELEEDVVVTQVYQYDGLLLCVTRYHSCLVWNPYLGQTRWIKPPRNTCGKTNSYALGYDKNRNHKILRFVNYDLGDDQRKYQIEIYNFSSNAWRSVLDHHVNTDPEEPNYHTSVSLKGNTYILDCKSDQLLCFDFTIERFGPRLPLPFKPLSPNAHTMALSCVRDEKLALLYHHYNTLERIKIWISTKIEPNEISWTMFFKLDSNHLPHDFPHYVGGIRFFIDEEKKLALLFRINTCNKRERRCCIIGEDRFINYVNIGDDALNNHWDYSNLVNSSYVPSLVQPKVHQED